MREIKFRAYDTEEKAMFLDFSTFTDDFTTLLNETIKYLIENNNLKIMQYTGLKDKNGKEIYFGDLLKQFHIDGDCESFIKVEENKDQLGIMFAEWDGEEWDYYLTIDRFDMDDLNEIAKQHEVVGNIYENPELLEVQS